ncbi:uncharacterized protein LOC124432464 [Vespa crabro]|uniref:uncharacterized protein LOC124432464 n=1 Tax=Vespa crabro TaxID=7445 RepID=UPI001F017ED6|nr:uncharacterized protein LOC124432464 [Vespa crabro]
MGIANVRRSFIWSSRFLKCMGIWPLKNYVPIFLFFFTYLTIHCSLTLAQLFWTPKTLENVVSNIAENIALSMTLTKITIARINREALRKLFTEIEEFSLTEKYETKEEKLTFVNYTKLPPYFIIIIAFSMTVVEVLYYTSRLIEGIQLVQRHLDEIENISNRDICIPYQFVEYELISTRKNLHIVTDQITK